MVVRVPCGINYFDMHLFLKVNVSYGPVRVISSNYGQYIKSGDLQLLILL